MSRQPLISIITATLNSAKTIAGTLDSIISQDYKHIEHIIVDGKSSDNTLEIVESYRAKYDKRDFKLKISSQKDSGIYDAFNRGIKLASGEIVGFLNSDDYFASNYVVSLIHWAFSKPLPSNERVQSISANVEYIDTSAVVVRIMKGRNLSEKDFRRGLHPAHPTFYVKRAIFRQYGGFDTRYKIASDYELMLRFLLKHNIKHLYIDDNVVKMRIGGASNASLKNIFKANVECLRAWRDNDLDIFPLFILLKPLQKLKYVHFAKYLKAIIFSPNRGGDTKN